MDGPGPTDTLETRELDGRMPTHDVDSRQGLDTLPAGGSEPGSSEPHAAKNADDRGSVIGRFVILRKLGEGSMGVVFAAYDEELDRRVAIKVLRASSQSDNAIARLMREAQGLARVSHPNVVQIHQIGRHRDTVFIAMEFVSGVTLREWSKSDPDRDWREILETVLQAGRGLAAAHDAKLVHRDFKPANVIVADDGRARVLDFGLARTIERNGPSDAEVSLTAPDSGIPNRLRSEDALVTGTGMIVGTPAYMPVEQLNAEPVDEQSDQFAFCVVLFECLYGVRPFWGPNLEGLMTAIYRGEIRKRPADTEVPRSVHEIILRGLSTDPHARWPDMPTLLRELEKVLEKERNRWMWAAGAAVAVVVLAGLAAVPWVRGKLLEQQQRIEAQNQRIAEEQEHANEIARQRELEKIERQNERQRELDTQGGLTARLLADTPGQRLMAMRLAVKTYGRYVIEGETPVAEVEAGIFAVTRRLHRARELVGHEAEITGLAYSPDSALLATASADLSARLWSTDTGEQLGLLKAHAAELVSVEFSPSGERLLTASKDGTAMLWQVDTREEIDSIYSGVTQAYFISDDELAVVHDDGSLTLWAAAGSELEQTSTVLEPGPPITQVELDREARLLLALNNQLVLADLSGPSHKTLTNDAPSGPLAIARGGTHLAAAHDDGSVRVWSPTGAQLASLPSADGHPLSTLAFAPEGKRLLTASIFGQPQIWNVEEATVLVPLEGHRRGALDAVFTSDGTFVATVSGDKLVRLLRSESGREIGALESRRDTLRRVQFAPDDDQVATFGANNVVHLWDSENEADEVLDLAIEDPLTAIALSPDQSRVVTVDEQGRACIWAIATGERQHEIGNDGVPVINVAFSPDGRRVALSDASRRVSVWDARTGIAVTTLPGEGRDVTALAFSPNNKQLATGDFGGDIELWSLDDSESISRWKGSESAVTRLVFSEDGTMIAVGSLMPVVRVWSSTGELRLQSAAPNMVNDVAFSPDGTRLAAAGEFPELLVWDIASGAIEHEFQSSEPVIYALAFSPDGTRIVSGGDEWLQLWDVEHGRQVADVARHDAPILRVMFSASSAYIHAGHTDGRVIRSIAASDRRLTIACEVLLGLEAAAEVEPLCKRVLEL